MLFSPPSIIRETLPEGQEGEEAFGHPPNRSNTSLESSGCRSPIEKVQLDISPSTIRVLITGL